MDAIPLPQRFRRSAPAVVVLLRLIAIIGPSSTYVWDAPACRGHDIAATTLPNGITVELVAMGHATARNQPIQWITPDGSPTKSPPAHRMGNIGLMWTNDKVPVPVDRSRS